MTSFRRDPPDSEPPWLILRYYAYRATSSAGFYFPISILHLHDQGLGLAFIGLTQATFSVAMVLAEVPSGYLGDRIGRRATLAVGNALRGAAMVAYALVDAPLAYLAVQVVWASGWAFRSGTQDAWLYEVLAARFDESEYARIEGRGSTVLLVTSAGAALTSGLLYGLDPAVPFVVNAALAAAGIGLLYTFPDVGDEIEEVFTAREAVATLRLQVGRPKIRWLVAYAALFAGLFSVTRWLEQPALDAVGLPVAGFGALYAGFKLASAGAAATAGWLDERLGTRRVFALMAPVYAVAYAAIAFVPVALIPVLFVNRSISVATRPVRNQYLNDRLDDVGRATVLSGASMVLSLSGAAANLVGGWVVASTGPVAFLPWAGVAIAAVGGILWLATSPVRSLGGSATADPGRAVPSE